MESWNKVVGDLNQYASDLDVETAICDLRKIADGAMITKEPQRAKLGLYHDPGGCK
jgi:hypothetical protein